MAKRSSGHTKQNMKETDDNNNCDSICRDEKEEEDAKAASIDKRRVGSILNTHYTTKWPIQYINITNLIPLQVLIPISVLVPYPRARTSTCPVPSSALSTITETEASLTAADTTNC